MTENLGGGRRREEPPPGAWNAFGAENIAPLVVWLGSEQSAGVTGQVFVLSGGTITVAEGWRRGPAVTQEGRWDPGLLGEIVPELLRQAGAPPD